MSENNLSLRCLLDIIFKTTKKNASILADRYLLKDVSIIYKWKCNKVIPKNEDLLQIVEFTISESTEAQRGIIRDGIEQIIINSPLKDDIKQTILNTDTFDDFLTETLNVSTVTKQKSVLVDESIEAYSESIDKKVSTVKNEKINEEELSSGQGIDGEYSGVMKFDLVLNKKNDGSESSTILHNLEFENVKSTSRKKSILFGDYKRKITITSIVVIGTLINFFVLNALYNNPKGSLDGSEAMVKDNKIALQELVNATSSPEKATSTAMSSKDVPTDAKMNNINETPGVVATQVPSDGPYREKVIPTPVISANAEASTKNSGKPSHSSSGSNLAGKASSNTNNTNVTINNPKDSTITTNINNTTINNYNITKDQEEKRSESVYPDTSLMKNRFRGVKVEELGSNHVKLSWPNPMNIKNFKHILVFRKEGNSKSDSPYNAVGLVAVGTESFTDSRVTSATQYTYCIMAESGSSGLLPLMSDEFEVVTK